MRKLSNKLIGAAGSSEEEEDKTASVSAAKVAGGVAEESGDVMASQPAADEGTAAKERIKMSQECIDWILSRKRRVFKQEDPDEYYHRMINDPDRPEVYTQQFLEEERHLMRNMATLFERAGDRLEKFQRWVRDELETKGCVEVDDDYLEQRINYRESYKKLHDAMMRVPGFIYKYSEDDAEKQAVESN